MLAPSVRDLTLFFDLLAPRWDAMQTADRSARLARLLAPHASLFEDARRVLDIGTGTGAFLPHLARLAPGARVIAVDLSPVMLDMARASAPGNAAWLLADVHHLPLRSGSVDLVTCHNSFAHFEDRSQALRELARLLAPGGMLFILHDLPREQVNAIHSRAESPRVRRHLLPPVEFSAAHVAAAEFDVLIANDSDHYLIIARRA